MKRHLPFALIAIAAAAAPTLALAQSSLTLAGNDWPHLLVTLKDGATTLFNDFLTGSRLFSYNTTLGATGMLELTLTSEANAGFLTAAPGGFAGYGLVNVTTPVPEPETYLLLVSGLLATRLLVRRRKA